MPVLWWIPTPLLHWQRQSQPVSQWVDPDLIVSAPAASYDPASQTHTFSGGVIAKYDVDTIRCDYLIVRLGPADRSATAQGHVSLEDPEGHVTADRLDFTWQPGSRHATAQNVIVRLKRTTIEAGSADLSPTKWEFSNVRATPETGKPPDLQLRTRKVVVFPGRKANVQRPEIWLFGKHILTVPNRSIILDPRTQGVALPSISYQRDHGLGASWQFGKLLDDRTNVYGSASAYPREEPGATFLATRTFVPPTRSSAVFSPGSELGERFRFGYFENVYNDSPSAEHEILGASRNSISIGSTLNSTVTTLHDTDLVTKPFEAVYETSGMIGARKPALDSSNSGPSGGLAAYGQVRLQDIRDQESSVEARAMFSGSLELPSVSIGPRLTTLSRLDTGLFLGTDRYGWERLSLGLMFDPIKQLRLSGALVGSLEQGRAQFDFDRLEDRTGVHLRADVNLGSTRVSYLLKYDTTLKWYDREYMISQVAGSFEPFLLFRRYPQTYTLGVRIRLEELSDILSRREFHRLLPHP